MCGWAFGALGFRQAGAKPPGPRNVGLHHAESRGFGTGFAKPV